MRLFADRADRRFRHYCRTGDPAALGDVFDATAGRLSRVALWLTSDRTDAEDLLQATFLKAIETRGQFRLDAPVLPWLMGLLGNEARRQRRERQRAAATRAREERSADPRTDAAVRELEDTVRSIGERIGEPYRDVLRLHLEGGLNCQEIAARLHRPAGTVRTQLMRALDALRRRLPAGLAGASAVAALAPPGLAMVRDAIVAGARAALPVVAATTAPASLAVKPWLLVAPVVLVAGAVITMAVMAQTTSPPWIQDTASFDSTPQSSLAQTQSPVAVTRIAVPLSQDPAVQLPVLDRLGTPVDAPRITVAADGTRTGAAQPVNDVVLRVDRNVAWHEVVRLIDELRGQGITRVQFEAQLARGATGCFAVALPADGAGAAFEIRLHRERPGVPPASHVPVLSRMVRGRQTYLANCREGDRVELAKSFSLTPAARITAPGDAAFGHVLQVLAATHRAGVGSVLLASAGAGGVAHRGALAMDLGPAPFVTVAGKSLPSEAAAIESATVGCTNAAIAALPERLVGGGAGGRYGSRGSLGPLTRNLDGWSPRKSTAKAFTWLTSLQHADGSLLGEDGRPDFESTALFALALLGNGTQLQEGDHRDALNRAVGWLLDAQDADGCYAPHSADRVRNHALATYAIAEAYGLSFSMNLLGSLEDAVSWLGSHQQRYGGFGDAATTAMAIMAFETATFFRVEVPCDRAELLAWFDRHRSGADATASAAEFMARFFAGENVKNDAARATDAYHVPKVADARDPWTLFWTSMLAYQLGGETWQSWLTPLRDVASRQLSNAGTWSGSWEPAPGLSRASTSALHALSLLTFSRYSRLVR